MFRKIFSYRIIAYVISAFILVNAVAFTVGGILMSIKGIYLIFTEGLEGESKPGIYILESVDVFLLALVFLIFAIGIIKLFVPDAHRLLIVKDLKWLQIRNFTDLKLLLWESVMVTLVVFFLTTFIHSEEHLNWNMLALPVAIFLLAASYFVMMKSGSHHNHEPPPKE